MRRGAKSPKRPILVVGLPGIGNVGRLVAEHLRKQFHAERLATIYSPHFPPQAVMLKNGCLRLAAGRLYLIEAQARAGNDILLLTGDAQPVTPEGQYSFNSTIVDMFKKVYNGTFIYTIGGYSISETPVNEPRVFGNATTRRVIEDFKDSGVLFGQSRGAIMGSAGLIITFARMRALDGVCLMGETSFLDVDAAAAKAVLLVLSKRLRLPIDTARLDAIVTRTSNTIREIEAYAHQQEQHQTAQGQQDQTNQRPSYIR